MEKHIIMTVITDQHLPTFKRKLEEFIKNNTITQIKKGCSLIPIQSPTGQMGVMPVPYAYIEYQVTETEYLAWKSNLNLR